MRNLIFIISLIYKSDLFRSGIIMGWTEHHFA